MRILDENNNEIQNYDLDKGYIKEDKLFVKHHEVTEAVEEQGHWKVIAEYPNGGKDVEWVVDTPGVEEVKEPYDEYEDIYRYVLYTPEELAEIEKAKNMPTTEELLNILMGVTE